MDNGIRVGIITGRRSQALLNRCSNLGIDLILDGVEDKVAGLEQILDQTGILVSQTAFIGDDLPDLGIMHKVGLAVAVADAHPALCRMADIITTSAGGCGAVREICEKILIAQDLFEKVINRFD